MPWSSSRVSHQTQRRRWGNSWKFAPKGFAFQLWAQGPTSSGTSPAPQISPKLLAGEIPIWFPSQTSLVLWERWAIESEKVTLRNTSLPDWGVRQCCECVYHAGGGDNDQGGGQRRGEWGWGRGETQVKATLHLCGPDAHWHSAVRCLAAITVKRRLVLNWSHVIQNMPKIYNIQHQLSSDTFLPGNCNEDDLKQIGTECGPLPDEQDLKQTGNIENFQTVVQMSLFHRCYPWAELL